MNDELRSMAIDIIGEDALSHHQIVGGKWGVRNGPPYPLSRSQLSGEQKKAYPEGSNEGQKEEIKEKKSLAGKISDSVKKTASGIDNKIKSTARSHELKTVTADQYKRLKSSNSSKYTPEEMKQIGDRLKQERSTYLNSLSKEQFAKITNNNFDPRTGKPILTNAEVQRVANRLMKDDANKELGKKVLNDQEAAKEERLSAMKDQAAFDKAKAEQEANNKAEIQITQDRMNQIVKDAKDEAFRQSGIYNLSASELMERQNEFSNSELSAALARLDITTKIQQKALDEAKNANALHDEAIKKANHVKDTLGVVIGYGQKAVELYDLTAKLTGSPTLSDKSKAMVDLWKEDYKLRMADDRKAEKDKANAKENDKKQQKINKYAEELAAKIHEGNQEAAKDVYAKIKNDKSMSENDIKNITNKAKNDVKTRSDLIGVKSKAERDLDAKNEKQTLNVNETIAKVTNLKVKLHYAKTDADKEKYLSEMQKLVNPKQFSSVEMSKIYEDAQKNSSFIVGTNPGKK